MIARDPINGTSRIPILEAPHKPARVSGLKKSIFGGWKHESSAGAGGVTCRPLMMKGKRLRQAVSVSLCFPHLIQSCALRIYLRKAGCGAICYPPTEGTLALSTAIAACTEAEERGLNGHGREGAPALDDKDEEWCGRSETALGDFGRPAHPGREEAPGSDGSLPHHAWKREGGRLFRVHRTHFLCLIVSPCGAPCSCRARLDRGPGRGRRDKSIRKKHARGW
jgi:hypothetical protein